MEIIEKKPELLVLKTDIDVSLANALRRSVEEIKTLAVDEVEFVKNDSALYDEVVAHRIGLIPLKTDIKANEKSEVELKIKKTGPGIVYSGDIVGGAKPAYSQIPITLLEKNQNFEAILTARMGSGLDHAKYVPGLCYYRHLLEVKSSPEIDKIVLNNSSPFKPKKEGSKWICDINDAQVEEITKISEDSVKQSNELLIFVESWGHFDSEIILKKSIEKLGLNLEEFEKAIK